MTVPTPIRTMTVIKRDGREVPFDRQKIVAALLKTEQEVHGTPDTLRMAALERLVTHVVAEIHARFQHNIKIYEIQNIVEHLLIQHHHTDLAEAYIAYRTRRDMERTNVVCFTGDGSILMNLQEMATAADRCPTPRWRLYASASRSSRPG